MSTVLYLLTEKPLNTSKYHFPREDIGICTSLCVSFSEIENSINELNDMHIYQTDCFGGFLGIGSKEELLLIDDFNWMNMSIDKMNQGTLPIFNAFFDVLSLYNSKQNAVMGIYYWLTFIDKYISELKAIGFWLNFYNYNTTNNRFADNVKIIKIKYKHLTPYELLNIEEDVIKIIVFD